MILNGTEKCIIKPDGSKINIADHIDENKPEEIGKVMTRIYYDNGLDKGLFAITGQLCLGRGLTFQNENFMFGFGIIPPMSDAANAYQCACRMAGNIKKVNGYRQATLVTTMKMKQTILKQEDVAATLARRVYDGEISSEVGEEEFGIAQTKRDSVSEDNFESEWSEWFKTEAEVNRLWSARGGKPQLLKSKDGYIVCSTTGAPMPHHISEIERFKAGKKTTNMPGASKMKAGEVSMRRYVAYENLDDKDSVRFCLHWIKHI